MSTDDPMYYSRQQLAARAGVSIRTFTKHEAVNAGNLLAAREIHPGIGIAYKATGCRKYLALAATGKKQKPKAAAQS